MQYKISWAENKSPDWKVVTAEGLDGTKLTDASINRTSKTGEVFPNFDAIAPGAEIEADPWKNNAGKWYLFTPKAQKPQGGAYRGSGGGIKSNMKAVMEQKQEAIKVSQENKELGIKVSSTIRMAVDLAIADPSEEPLESKIKQWRTWLWREWNVDEKDMPPF